MYQSLYVSVSCPVYIVVFLSLCVLSCIYCRMSYVIYLWACVSESIYMYQSLYVCVSCPVYIVVCLMLSIYGRVSVRACTCIKVCMFVCLVLYILSYVICYLFMGVCQWEHVHVSKFVCLCVLSCTYCRMSYVIYWWACVSEQWLPVALINIQRIYTIMIISLKHNEIT
jgi:hypothetical protein